MPVRRVELGPVGRTVKENIRVLRMNAHLTQGELAALAGLPAQSVTEIENGARRVNVDDLVLLSNALQVSVLEILGQK